MFNPFRMFCFAPDGVPDGAPAADAENEQEQHETSSLKRPSRPGTLRRKQRRRLHPLARSSLPRRMNPRRTTTRRMTSLRAL